MIQDGQFGEEMKDAILDGNRWQRIYDDLIDVPNDEIIVRDGLHLFYVTDSDGSSAMYSDETPLAAETGPTTGPKPTSWTGVVERCADQVSFTYVFQFGERELWKIGHAIDVDARLMEVNKHVPHEVLGEQWRIVLRQGWPTQLAAYEMEQRLLKTLRTASSVGERIACGREALETAWASMSSTPIGMTQTESQSHRATQGTRRVRSARR